MNSEQRLRELAEKVSLNLDTAQKHRPITDHYIMDCPTCEGEGTVDLEGDYCNIDGAALGVMFYGIGPEHGLAEEYFRAVNPQVILAFLDELDDAKERAHMNSESEREELIATLRECEQYVRAYKCDVNPIATRQDASVFLKRLDGLLDRIGAKP